MSETTTKERQMDAYLNDPANRALSLLWSLSEPIGHIDENRIIDCPTCDGATRTFDDPAECPDCAGARYLVL